MKLVQSAGLLMYRLLPQQQFFLVHPGGPFWKNKDVGAWSIPKGLVEESEELLDAARREFYEETGIEPSPPFQSLGTSKMKSGKVIHAWTFKGSWDPQQGIISNYIDIEFPPQSKKFISIPEVDRAEWINLEKALVMVNPAQVVFLKRAADILKQ